MVAYNFQKQFADKVASGEKRQTIRANGKRTHAKEGDIIQLYTGLRTKACRKLGEAVCKGTTEIFIDEHNVTSPCGTRPFILGDDFAKRDGFKDKQDMIDWFRKTHGLPFKGTLIVWEQPIKTDK